MLSWINRKLERNSINEMGGIPLMWLIYQPNKPEPNMEFRLYPSIKHDEYIKTRLKEIADYLRENYCDEWEYLKRRVVMSLKTEALFDLEKIRLEELGEIIERVLTKFEDNPNMCWTQIPMEKPLWETLKSALKKQTSVKVVETPAYQSYFSVGDESEILCPSCEEELDIENQTKHCCECGQKLDWGDIVW